VTRSNLSDHTNVTVLSFWRQGTLLYSDVIVTNNLAISESHARPQTPLSPLPQCYIFMIPILRSSFVECNDARSFKDKQMKCHKRNHYKCMRRLAVSQPLLTLSRFQYGFTCMHCLSVCRVSKFLYRLSDSI